MCVVCCVDDAGRASGSDRGAIAGTNIEHTRRDIPFTVCGLSFDKICGVGGVRDARAASSVDLRRSFGSSLIDALMGLGLSRARRYRPAGRSVTVTLRVMAYARYIFPVT